MSCDSAIYVVSLCRQIHPPHNNFLSSFHLPAIGVAASGLRQAARSLSSHENKKRVFLQRFKCYKNTRHGAAGGTRTRTPIRTQAPQACQSTSSSTAAKTAFNKLLIYYRTGQAHLSTIYSGLGKENFQEKCKKGVDICCRLW